MAAQSLHLEPLNNAQRKAASFGESLPDGGFRASVPLLLGPNSVNVEAIAPSGKSDIKYVRVRRE